MAEMIKTIEHLSTEIGPRPVATEEEQQAALYIAQELEALGFSADVEEFQGSVSHKKTRLFCSAVAVVLAILSLFLPVIALPAVIGTFVCAALFMAEEFGHPVLSKILDKGISQNVVARYVPPAAQEGKARRRKVVLVARTDSGSVRPELNPPVLAAMPILAKAARVGIVALPVFLLIRSVFFLHSTGVAFVVTTIFLILICICAALPAISFAMEKAAGLNDGANSSASGVAVMLEVARRIAGKNEDDQPIIHGAQAARAADVVPEGTELVYETQDSGKEFVPVAATSMVGGSAISAGYAKAASGVVAAASDGKAGIGASFTDAATTDVLPAGAPPAAADAAAGAVPGGVFAVADAASTAGAAAVAGAAGSAVDAAAAATVAAMPAAPAPTGSSDSQASLPAEEPASAAVGGVPSWFVAGRAAARRNDFQDNGQQPVKRSTFATALEAAEQRLNAAAEESLNLYGEEPADKIGLAMPNEQYFERAAVQQEGAVPSLSASPADANLVGQHCEISE